VQRVLGVRVERFWFMEKAKRKRIVVGIRSQGKKV